MKKSNSLASWIDPAEIGRIVARLRSPRDVSDEDGLDRNPGLQVRDSEDPAAYLIGAFPDAPDESAPSDPSDPSDLSDESDLSDLTDLTDLTDPPSLPTRLASFGDWVCGEMSCGAVFVADEQGSPLLIHEVDPSLVSSSVLIAAVARNAVLRMELGGWRSLRIRFTGGVVLTLAHLACARGSFDLGLVSPGPLPEDVLERVLPRLGQALAGCGESPEPRAQASEGEG